jgi:formate hydrogenlyase subunit 6/NADH:ubiquinone oxidoreductase subunit I
MNVGYMLKETLKALFSKPVTVQSVTRNESVQVPERYRGMVEYDREACIGCLLCIKTCPTGTILIAEAQKVQFRLDRCVFCGQCAEICPKNAIKMSSDSEIITNDRKRLILK